VLPSFGGWLPMLSRSFQRRLELPSAASRNEVAHKVGECLHAFTRGRIIYRGPYPAHRSMTSEPHQPFAFCISKEKFFEFRRRQAERYIHQRPRGRFGMPGIEAVAPIDRVV